MTRKQIRLLIRALADELTERPEGLWKDSDASETNLNDIINLAQENIYLELVHYLPWYFRKSKTFATQANKATYTIASDLSITDLFMFDDIYTNETGKKPIPLNYIDPDEIGQYGDVGATAEPKAFGYEDKDTIFLRKIPDGVYNYKAYYFYAIPDLNHDTSDVSPNVATPHLPKQAHKLIAYEALEIWAEREGVSTGNIAAKKEKILTNVQYKLSLRQGLTTGKRPSAREILSS